MALTNGVSKWGKVGSFLFNQQKYSGKMCDLHLPFGLFANYSILVALNARFCALRAQLRSTNTASLNNHIPLVRF